jgi:hypothetical protein
VSAGEVLDALFAPSFERGHAEAQTVQLYLRRLLALGRTQTYTYLHAHGSDVLNCLPKPRERAEFVLSTWYLAPAEHWEYWANLMPQGSEKDRDGEGGPALAPQVSRLVARMLEQAASLEPEAVRSIAAHLDPLRPALASMAIGNEVDVLVSAAEAALSSREWWVSAELVEDQSAIHDLLRAVEERCPASRSALQDVRTSDVRRAPMDEAGAVQGAVALAIELSEATFGELREALPSADSETQPQLYAEVLAASAVLQERDPNVAGGFWTVRENLKGIQALRQMGQDYWPQRRRAGVACLDLSPSPSQIEALRIYLGANPGEDGMAALSRWSQRNNRKRVAAALSRLIRPYLDATSWASVISQGEYLEAPVVRALAEQLGERKQTSVAERRRMARIVGALNLRTQSGRDAVADLIVDLLKKERPKSDLSVALVLATGLGPEHRCHTKLERAFASYARRHSHKFTPDEYRSVVQLGITFNQKLLSKKAEKSRKEIVEEAVKGGVKQLASKLPGLR